MSAIVLDRRYGLDQGFRLWDEALTPRAAGEKAEERDAAAATDAALRLLGQLKPPFFLWVHYYDPHVDYRPPARLLAAQKGPHAAYDGEIAYVDEQLGRLLAALPAGAAWSPPSATTGRCWASTARTRTACSSPPAPGGCRCCSPGRACRPGESVEPLVRTVDLLPTLLALAGAPAAPAADLDGESLLPLLAGGATAAEAPRISYTESFMPLFSYRWYPLRALSDGRWLYVDAPKARLFDLAADPGEGHDLAAARPEEAARWGKALAERIAAWGEEGKSPSSSPLSAEERGKLAALGYLAGSGHAGDLAGLPDPNELIDIANRLPELKKEIDAGGCEKAQPELRSILRRNRDNLPALVMAGLCLMDGERYAEALPYFEHAVAVSPDDVVARADQAGCLLKLGRTGEAEAAYRQALDRDPTAAEAVANLARLLRERGDDPGAADVVGRAIEAAGPSGADPRWLVERGLAFADSGHLEPALTDFLTAADANRHDSVALENAAQAAYHLGRVDQAVDLYRRLADLDPKRSGPWKTLGAIQLNDLEDPVGARASFQRALAVETDPAERSQIQELLGELAQ